MDLTLLRRVEQEFARRRALGDVRFREETAAFFSAHPVLDALEKEKRGTVSDRALAPEARQKKIADINKKMNGYLSENGLALPVRTYECAECRDTGTREDGTRCPCFTRRLIEETKGVSEDFMPLSFDAFDPSVFAPEDRPAMEKTRDFCLAYADRYPETKKRSLILSGHTGTGKTFLMRCIATRLAGRGFSVVYLTAGHLFELLRRYAFSQGDIDLLTDADVLFIDDLGSEPMFKNVTNEYLFLLLNERSSRRKPTCATTNLTPDQLKSHYSERLTSRLLDQTDTHLLHLQGRDLRTAEQPHA